MSATCVGLGDLTTTAIFKDYAEQLTPFSPADASTKPRTLVPTADGLRNHRRVVRHIRRDGQTGNPASSATEHTQQTTPSITPSSIFVAPVPMQVAIFSNGQERHAPLVPLMRIVGITISLESVTDNSGSLFRRFQCSRTMQTADTAGRDCNM